MGNAPSSPSQAAHHEAPRALPLPPPKPDPQEPRRRKSIATPSTSKATARPSVTLDSVTAETSNESARSILSATESARSIYNRRRAGSTASTSTRHETMGNQESRQAHSKKAVSGPYRPPQTKTKPINVPADRQQQQQPTTAHDPPSSPQQQQHQQQQSQPQSPQPMPFDSESYSMNTSAISRPPRLPLPIEEEDYTPGSPIISPADVSRIGPVGPIEPLEEVAGFPRRSSVLSSTTLDDDDLGDDLGSLEGGPHVPVPTLLEWREAGDKVYVTGTFAGWDRKFRLHKNGPSKHPGALSAIINLQPGTHHVRFIVDNDMKLSKYMPTAVDFTNFLVNYIEVGPEDIQTAAAALHSLQLDGKGPPTTQPKPIAGAIAPQPQVTEELAQTPQVLPAAEEPKDALAEQLIKGKPLVPAEPKSYHGKIPGFLLDLDAPEEGEGKETCAKVNSLVNTLPSPPTLPMFLAKSILNGNPPMRDDASVLILPNHTVLNHLATSSIRNGVLATSGTTRYKQKFLTTIMYKPTGRD